MAMNDVIKRYVSYEQILRYLHYNVNIKIGADLQEIIQEAIAETFSLVQFKSYFQCEPIIQTPMETWLMNCELGFKSQDLTSFLRGSSEMVLSGVTLGHTISKRIENRMLVKPSYGIILDACASVLADAYCDYIQDSWIENGTFSKYFLSQRYSPGYGDLSITENKVITKILNLEKNIGLYTTEHGQLIPEKSVIFVLGLSHTPFKAHLRTCGGACESCLLTHCTYRRG